MEELETDVHRPSCIKLEKHISRCNRKFSFSVTDLHNRFRQMSFYFFGNATNIYLFGKTLIILLVTFFLWVHLLYYWNSANMFMIYARDAMESNVNLHSRYEHDVYHIIGGFIHCIKKTIKKQRGVRKICRLAISNCLLCSWCNCMSHGHI